MMQFVGVSDTFMVPMFLARLLFAQGALNTGAGDLSCLLVGMKTSAGTMVADTDIAGPVSTKDEVDVYAGAGSQLAMQAYAALDQNVGAKIYLGACAEPAGTKATYTIVLGGTWTAAGTVILRIAGKSYRIAVAANDTIDTLGAYMATFMAGDPRCPFSHAYNAGTDTLTGTCRNNGVTGNDWLIFVDLSEAPAGLTATLTGSASVTGGGVRAGVVAGTGTPDVTNILTKIAKKRYARIAPAQSDATNAGLWRTHVRNAAAPLVQFYEQVIFGVNGTQSAATTLAQTTLNEPMASVVAMRNSEWHPCMLAAATAAIRAAGEGGSAGDGWNPSYNGRELVTAPAYTKDTDSDNWSVTEQDALLQAGVTPITGVDSAVRIVRAVTSYSQISSGVRDDRCVDVGKVVFPQNAIRILFADWIDFRTQNRYAVPDPATPEEEEPPAGVAYPKLWTRQMMKRGKEWFKLGLIRDPELTPPESTYNETAKGIESVVRWVVNDLNHSVRVTGMQTSL